MEPVNDWTKNVSMSGNKVINVANPENDQDASTKSYVDAAVRYLKQYVDTAVEEEHNRTPLNDRTDYINAINTKEETMISLVGLCRVSTSWTIHEDRNPHEWLECMTNRNVFWFETQKLKGKFIQVQYLFPVWVKEWKFRLHFHPDYVPIPITFSWRFSEDGTKWKAVGKLLNAPITVEEWNGNTHVLKFTNPTAATGEEVRFWRIVAATGETPTHKNPWVNLLSMNIE